MSRDLTHQVWPEVETDQLLLIPLGSCEQHGPHLPLNTDAVIAETLAAQIAQRLERLGIGNAVAPTLAFGSSGEHQDFPGTLSIGTDALGQVLVELVRSASTWCARMLFVNGHGGNLDALGAAVGQMRGEGHDVAWIDCAMPGGDAHAGHAETSLMLVLDPEHVGSHEQVQGSTEPIQTLLPHLRSAGIAAVSANGVLGDARAASAEHGRNLLEAAAEDMTQAVVAWRVPDSGRLTGADHTPRDIPRS